VELDQFVDVLKTGVASKSTFRRDAERLKMFRGRGDPEARSLHPIGLVDQTQIDFADQAFLQTAQRCEEDIVGTISTVGTGMCT
jgi:hypothetical protein